MKKQIEFLINFKQTLEEKYKLMEIDFGDKFSTNYLKLVSNIYYLNLKKVQEVFKENYIKKHFFFKDDKHLSEVLNELHEKMLKETR